jgi:hypothetical protein
MSRLLAYTYKYIRNAWQHYVMYLIFFSFFYSSQNQEQKGREKKTREVDNFVCRKTETTTTEERYFLLRLY